MASFGARYFTLDVLRAIAVFLVYVYHAGGAPLISRFGWIGVDLFFVLSGFLVSGLLFREYKTSQEIAPGRFLLRRAFKIYPQFYVLIGATVLAILCVGGRPPKLPLLAEVFFFQNYTEGIWSYTWSLAVEEHFYLLLALVTGMFARRGGVNPFRRLPQWVVGTMALIFSARVLTWALMDGIEVYRNLCPTHLRADTLLIGVLISYYHHFHDEQLQRWVRGARNWMPAMSILLLSPLVFLPREHPFIATVGFSMVAVGFGILLLSAIYPMKVSTAPGSVAKAFAAIGHNSYGMYLWHGPILLGAHYYAVHFGALPRMTNSALSLLVTIAVGMATTAWIETPFLALRERMVPARPRRANAVSAEVFLAS